MSLSDPMYNSFKLYIPPNWFYEDVVKDVWLALRQMDLPYDSVEAYMNSTIINGMLPGLKDDGSGEQVHSFGKTKKFKGSLRPEESVTKTFNVSFKLKDNFLNWIIFYKQMLSYLDHKNEKQFMQPIFMHILDDYGNVIITLVYHEIRLLEVPPLDFRKQDRGILTKEFQIQFGFNEFKLEFNLNNTVNHTKQEYQY